MTAIDGGAQPSEWQQRIAGEWHGRPALFDAEGNHVGFERVDRASVVEDGVAALLDGHLARGARPAAQPVRARRASSTSAIVDSDENRVYSGPGLLRHRPALRPVRRRPLLLARAGRPTCAPGTRCCPTARPRSTPRCCTTAGPSARSSTASTSAPSTTTPTRRRRRSSTTGSRWRPGAARRRRCCRPRSRAPGRGELFVNAADQSGARRGRRSRIEHEPLVAAPRPPARHLGRRARAQLHLRAAPRRRPHPVRGPGGLRQRARPTAGRSSPPSTSSTRTRAAWRRSRAARCCSTPGPASSPSCGSCSTATPLDALRARPAHLGGRMSTTTVASSSSPAAPAASASAWPRSCSPAAAGSSICGRSARTRSTPPSRELDARRRHRRRRRRHRPRPPCRRCGTTRSRRYGRVDIWINNAGHLRAPPSAAGGARGDASTPWSRRNLLGAHQRLRGRAGRPAAQAPRRLVWNMEGFGSGGQKQPGHGDVRRHQAGGHLPDRVAGQGDQGHGRSRSGFLSPGIVATDLLDRRLRRPAGGVREGAEDLQHPRRPGRDRDAVAGRPGARRRQARRPGRLADQAARRSAGSPPRASASATSSRRETAARPADGDRPLHRVRPGAGRSRTSSPCCSPGPAPWSSASPPGGRVPQLRTPALAGRCSWSPLGGLTQGDLEAAGRAPSRAATLELLEQLLFPCLAFGFAGIAWALVGARRGSAPRRGAVRRGARRSVAVAALVVGGHLAAARSSPPIGAVTVGVLARLLRPAPAGPLGRRAVRRLHRRHARAAAAGRAPGPVRRRSSGSSSSPTPSSSSASCSARSALRARRPRRRHDPSDQRHRRSVRA